jgi:hypothetical protein
MRTLVVGALAATLVGCSCLVSPQSGTEACTGADGRTFPCLDKNVATSRLSQAAEPDPASSAANSAAPRTRSAHAAKTTKPTAHAGDTSHAKDVARDAAKSTTTTTAKVEPAAAAQAPDAIDPVVDRAKIAVSVKLEDPASAAFSEMNRSMRKNTLGQSVDTICGHVKSKKASGEDIGDRPFLYLVKDDEAYVADGSPSSAASTAYRNICN